MKRLGNTLALAALSVGLVGCAPQPSPESNLKTHQELLTDFTNTWHTLGVVGVNETLVTVVSDQRADCSYVKPNGTFADISVTAQHNSPGLYCPEERAVVISAGAYNKFTAKMVEKGVSTEAVGATILAHELGHAVIGLVEGYRPNTPEQELEADCLAGEVMATARPDLLEQAQEIYKSLDGPNHGTPEQRLENFNHGAHFMGCGRLIPSGAVS